MCPAQASATVPWWRGAVVYQIYPRSFADADGDGIGDLAGIRARVDHLAWLGVDAVWLSPIFRSPMADFGYDISDYCDVDPLFGTLDDLDGLIADLHRRGIRLLLDWVPNHTSDQHPWFVSSRSSRTDPKRSWYVWRDPAPGGGAPNNWRAAFDRTAPAWTFDPPTGQYYLHCFLPQQPDLNWADPEVEAAMHDVVRFWLDRGVDGFRIDVVHLLGKDPALPDDPPHLVARGIPHCPLHDDERTHPILRRLRGLVDSYEGDRVTVGEVYLLEPAKVAPYYGSGDELHLSFNFAPLYASWDAAAWRRRIDETLAVLDPVGAWPTWVLSNHDNPRHRTRYGSEARARAAIVLLAGLRGTPFLYAGEELGLEDAVVPPARVLDPGGRDGCRAPIPWAARPGHGWGAVPWLPLPPEPVARSVERQRDDGDSMLQHYRRVLQVRRASPALTLGTFAWVASPPGVLAFERSHGDDQVLVVVNFAGEPAVVVTEAVPVAAGDGRVPVAARDGHVPVSASGGRVLVTSGRPDRVGRGFDGSVGADEALVVQR